MAFNKKQYDLIRKMAFKFRDLFCDIPPDDLALIDNSLFHVAVGGGYSVLIRKDQIVGSNVRIIFHEELTSHMAENYLKLVQLNEQTRKELNSIKFGNWEYENDKSTKKTEASKGSVGSKDDAK